MAAPESIKSNHRNVSPTWFGVVLAKHMQDPSITSELKAMVAVVSTFPRENWTWRGDHLRSLLNFGRERYQKVMREAKARGFVTVCKVSDGRSFQAEYQWSIDTPGPGHLPRAGNPKVGKPDQRESRPHNDRVKINDQYESQNMDASRTERVMPVTFQTFPQNENQQVKTVIPPDAWKRLTDFLSTELTGVEWREPERDNGALRRLWEICPDELAIMDALSEGASVHAEAEKIFGEAYGLLKYRAECDSNPRANVAPCRRPPVSASAARSERSKRNILEGFAANARRTASPETEKASAW